jgi:hypothetical protein
MVEKEDQRNILIKKSLKHLNVDRSAIYIFLITQFVFTN